MAEEDRKRESQQQQQRSSTTTTTTSSSTEKVEKNLKVELLALSWHQQVKDEEGNTITKRRKRGDVIELPESQVESANANGFKLPFRVLKDD